MARYDSWSSWATFLLGSALYTGWVPLFLQRGGAGLHAFPGVGRQSEYNIVQLIGGMQDIKLNNCEKQKRSAGSGSAY